MTSPPGDLKGVYFDDARRRWEFSYYDKWVTSQAELLTRGRDYTNFIIVAGYAAFFGLWAGLAQDLSSLVRLSAGGLMSISLLLFVSWELVAMHHRIASANRLGRVLSETTYPDDFESKWRQACARNARNEFKFIQLWPWVFYPTCFTGLLGGGILGVAAFCRIAQVGFR